jgi:hypothetical protein
LIGQSPPQSTSDSAPFSTVSVQLGAWHVPLQTELKQSELPRQSLPSSHFEHDEPQSTSVSLSFLILSSQLESSHIPSLQTPLRQSLSVTHFRPASHFPHAAPPQSTSDSAPFCTTSEQLGSWHMLCRQMWLAQSESALQPVSPGVVHFESTHEPLAQSAPIPHTLPSAQGVQLPPQSRSVSSPSFA